MAKQNVKSTDPRKTEIVAALKAKGGVTKVTNVVEVSPGVFEADGLKKGKGRGFENIGKLQVELAPAAPVRKSGSKKAITIQEACAADGCTNPPTKGGRCDDHQEAPKASKQTKTEKAPRKAKAAPKKEKETTVTVDAKETVEQLRAKGWSDASIGAKVGVTAQTVWCWRKRGSSCPYQTELLSLMMAEAPAKDVVRRPTAEPKARSIRAAVAASPKASNVKKATDPRQLVLGIRDYLDDVLAALNPKKK